MAKKKNITPLGCFLGLLLVPFAGMYKYVKREVERENHWGRYRKRGKRRR